MPEPRPSGPLLRLLDASTSPDGIRAAIEATLTGGPPIAPLPPDGGEATGVVRMLAPDVPCEYPDAAAVVATSGSTGNPKGVVLSRAAIRAGADATHQRLGGVGDWTLALPGHYVAGLMVIARAVVGGSRLRVVGSDLADLPTDPGPGRHYLSLVPTQLVRALADPRTTAALAAQDAVLLGGAAVDPAWLDRAGAQGITVVSTYGMSETSGGCVYDGIPLPGVDVHLDEAGRVSIGGPVLFSGYRLRPDLTAEAWVEGRLLTHDRAEWTDDRLRVLGRLDDVVISGGINVDLAEVEARCTAALNCQVAVLGVPDPEWGHRVVAVAATDHTLAELRGRLRGSLPPAALPRDLVRVGSLPLTSSGKIDRLRLKDDLSTGTMTRTEPDLTAGQDD